MENDKLVDIILKRLDVLESKLDLNKREIDSKLEYINQRLWFFAGIWAVIGGTVTIFAKKIIDTLLGA